MAYAMLIRFLAAKDATTEALSVDGSLQSLNSLSSSTISHLSLKAKATQKLVPPSFWDLQAGNNRWKSGGTRTIVVRSLRIPQPQIALY